MSEFNLKDTLKTSIKMKDANLISFVTLSQDQKYIFAGGFDKILHVYETADPINKHKELPLKYYAYCCVKIQKMLYIGGMNFI